MSTCQHERPIKAINSAALNFAILIKVDSIGIKK